MTTEERPQNQKEGREEPPRKEASCAVGPSGESQGGRVGLLLCSSCCPYSEFLVMRESAERGHWPSVYAGHCYSDKTE